MTNTLHRFGKPESLKDDYVVFAMPSKGANDIGALEKVRVFLTAALKYRPINIGNALTGPLYRPEKSLNPIKLYFTGRKEKVTPQQVIQDMTEPGSAAVVFDNRQAMEEFLKEVRGLDLGISVNVSALVDDVREACQGVGITPHSVEYSLGFHGDLFRLPDRHVLALTTMCGHGMISASFARKMIDRVREGRLGPEQASRYMAKFCVCGVFNTTRASRILDEARLSN
jgi:hypothetical protein